MIHGHNGHGRKRNLRAELRSNVLPMQGALQNHQRILVEQILPVMNRMSEQQGVQGHLLAQQRRHIAYIEAVLGRGFWGRLRWLLFGRELLPWTDLGPVAPATTSQPEESA